MLTVCSEAAEWVLLKSYNFPWSYLKAVATESKNLLSLKQMQCVFFWGYKRILGDSYLFL